MISGQKKIFKSFTAILLRPFARSDKSEENRKRIQTSTLQNNNNPQGTQYNRKKVKELVSYGEAIA